MSGSAASPAAEAWLEVADNSEAWGRLSDTLALAEGFELLLAVVPDPDSEGRLRELLSARARELGRDALILDARDEGPRAPAKRLLELETERPLVVLETLAASREGPAVLERCFTQLNPRRDQVRERLEGPLVVILRPDGLRRFVDTAPDLHSVHAAQFRFANSRPPPSPPKWLLTPREVAGLLGLREALSVPDQSAVRSISEPIPLRSDDGEVDEEQRDEIVAAIEAADRSYLLPKSMQTDQDRATLVAAARCLVERGWRLLWLGHRVGDSYDIHWTVVRELSAPEQVPPLDPRDAARRYLELTAASRSLIVFEIGKFQRGRLLPRPARPSRSVVALTNFSSGAAPRGLPRLSTLARSIFDFCREWSEATAARIPRARLAHLFAGEDLEAALAELTDAELIEAEGECVRLHERSMRRLDTRFLRPYLRSRSAVEVDVGCDDFEARALGWAARMLAPEYWIEFDDDLIEAAVASLTPRRRAGFYAALAHETRDELRGLGLHRRALQAAVCAYADPFEHRDESWRHLREEAPEAFWRLRVVALLSEPAWLVEAIDDALEGWARVDTKEHAERDEIARGLRSELRELAPRFGASDPGRAFAEAVRAGDRVRAEAQVKQLGDRVDELVLGHLVACAESWARVHLGAWEPARASVERATLSAQAWGSPFALLRARMLEFVLLAETGNLDEAAAQVDGLVERAEQLFGPIHPASADIFGRCSRVFAEIGQHQRAGEFADRCWSTINELEVQLPDVCERLAEVYEARGRADRSEALRRRAQSKSS